MGVLTEERDVARSHEEELFARLTDKTDDLEALQESYVSLTDRFELTTYSVLIEITVYGRRQQSVADMIVIIYFCLLGATLRFSEARGAKPSKSRNLKDVLERFRLCGQALHDVDVS